MNILYCFRHRYGIYDKESNKKNIYFTQTVTIIFYSILYIDVNIYIYIYIIYIHYFILIVKDKQETIKKYR